MNGLNLVVLLKNKTAITWKGGSNMGTVLKVIEKETSGVSFNSYKYCHDTTDRSGIDYDDNKDIVWKEYGETEKLTKPVNLKDAADARRGYPSIFSFFSTDRATLIKLMICRSRKMYILSLRVKLA